MRDVVERGGSRAKGAGAMTTCILIAACLTAGPDDAKLKSLADAYEANRQSFVNVDCHFQVEMGKCATINDAIAGRFAGETNLRIGRWTVRGPLVRYELGSEQRPLGSAAHKEDTRRVSFHGFEGFVPNALYDRECYLMSGGFVLRAGPDSRFATFFHFAQNESDGLGIRFHAFNIDTIGPNEVSNPVRALRDCVKGRFQGRYDGVQTINGHDLEVVRIGLPGTELRETCGFDPRRGHLLAFKSDKNPQTSELAYAAYVIEARESSSGHWFPTRLINVHHPESLGPYRTDVLSVTALNIDNPPADADFQMTVPAGTEVQLQGTPYFPWRLSHDIEVSSIDLPTIHAEFVKEGKKRERQRAVRHFFGGLRNAMSLPWSGRTWLLVGGVIAGVIVGIVGYRRYA